MKASPIMEPLMSLRNNVFRKKNQKQKFDLPENYTVTTIAGDGEQGFVDGPALQAKFKSPLDVAITPDGSIYVADAFNSCIRKIEAGQVSTFAGNGNANTTDGKGGAARFKIPSRLALDMNGNLYTLDAANPRVRKITAAAEVSTYAGINAIGFRDGDAATAQFGQGFGIVSDVVGNIYVADSQNNRIRKISTNQEVTTVAGTALQGNSDGKGDVAQFYFITGIAIDKFGNLFVSDINRIRKITSTGIVSTYAGSNFSGYVDGKKEIARFSQIEDLAIDDRGNIYLTDENRIRKINPQGLVTTVAGSVAGYKDGDATAAKFDGPQGLAIDKMGNIYVADFNNHRIRKIGVEQ